MDGKPDFSKIEQFIVAVSLGYLVERFTKWADTLQGYFISFGISIPYPVAAVIVITILALIFLRTASFLWDIVPKFWDRAIRSLKIPNPFNIQLNSGSIHNNVFTLKFKCTEWKYLLHKINVFVYTPVLYTRNDLPQTKEFFAWRNIGKVPMRVGKTYEIDFIQFDLEKNLFWFKLDNIEQEKFRFPGKLSRQINVEVVFISSVGNKQLASARRFFNVITTFQEPNDISAEMKNEIPVWEIEA